MTSRASAPDRGAKSGHKMEDPKGPPSFLLRGPLPPGVLRQPARSKSVAIRCSIKSVTAASKEHARASTQADSRTDVAGPQPQDHRSPDVSVSQLDSIVPNSNADIWGAISVQHPATVSLQPSTSRATTGPEATFTPMAAGLQPPVDPNPVFPDNMQAIIAEAIRQGISAGLQQSRRDSSLAPGGSLLSRPFSGSLPPRDLNSLDQGSCHSSRDDQSHLSEDDGPYQQSVFKMEIEDCNGRSYISGSGDSSLEKEFTSTIVGPTVSTPNSQHSSPSRSLSANSIKVEMYSDEESSRLLSHDDRLIEKEDSVIVEDSLSEPLGYCDGSGQEPHSPGGIRLPNGKLKCDICGMVCIGPNVLMVHKRSHTGERPFHCNQCGASFTQKGNLLRHIKLHSGEKPFKCPFCNYACRRRDALTGHLRTHSVSSPTVGKPYKCNYCGRSYKQQSTLEEHKERCHNYLQSLNTEPQLLAGQQGDEMRDLEMVPDSMLHSSADRPAFIDRLANSITKRKRSTPQKFIGEKHMRYSLSDMAYDVNSSFEKDVEMVAAHHPMDASFGSSLSFMGAEHLRPLRLPPTNCISEITPVISSVYTQIQPLPGRLEIASSREAAEGHEDLSDGTQIVYRASREPSMVSPSNGCQDSTDTESIHEERGSQQPLLSSIGNCSSSRQSPAYAKEDPKLQEGIIPTTTRSTPSSAKEALRVVNDEGEQVKAFKCEHCRILFLDHVMFTIHMGCHGFRDPFECNICGYHSQDRYEFSSHIVRGEHKVG